MKSPMSRTNNDPLVTGRPADTLQTYTTFRLSGGLFGTATEMVKEVTAVPPLTPIPHAPAAVRGYVNLRGHLVLVVDLNCLLRRGTTAVGAECRLVVLRPELGDACGMLVDCIGEIVELSAARIETQHAGQAPGSPRPSDWLEHELVCGVGKLDEELLSILDAHRLMPCLERAIRCRNGAADAPSFASEKEISL